MTEFESFLYTAVEGSVHKTDGILIDVLSLKHHSTPLRRSHPLSHYLPQAPIRFLLRNPPPPFLNCSHLNRQ